MVLLLTFGAVRRFSSPRKSNLSSLKTLWESLLVTNLQAYTRYTRYTHQEWKARFKSSRIDCLSGLSFNALFKQDGMRLNTSFKQDGRRCVDQERFGALVKVSLRQSEDWMNPNELAWRLASSITKQCSHPTPG